MPDLVIRGGHVITLDGMLRADVAIEDGLICEIGSELAAGREEIKIHGLTVFPGLIDAHVHFNEPGRTEWEGAATGSRAFAAGGGTLFFDMPLNSTPCTIDSHAFDQKRSALGRSSVTDFALWGGLVPGNAKELVGLVERGVIGFKAFLCDSGLAEFPFSDEKTLFEGMGIAARFGLPVAVHAESQAITTALAREALANGKRSIRDFLASRPVEAETEAIRVASLLALQAGAKLHIVHVSSGSGLMVALEARARGADISIETCPHYLFFTEEDVERLGAVAKCAPPLRSATEREQLWSHVLDGGIDIIGSDHSPAPPEMKTGDDFFRIWGGIAGVQATLAVLLEAGHHHRGLPLARVADLLATGPAKRFGIGNKGSIAIGHDADLALVNVSEPFVMSAETLLQRHPLSPYLGCRFRGKVSRTLLRGRTVGTTSGRLVRPQKVARPSGCGPDEGFCEV
jgi:allantoinase